MYLATLLAREGKTIVIDGDPQGTATDWAQLAYERESPLPFEVDSANRINLRRKISGYDWIVIDTEPGVGTGITDAALKVADVIIVPTRPLGADMARTWLTEAVAREYAPTYVLITQNPTTATRDRSAAFEVLDQEGVARFETYIPLRAAIGRAHGTIPGPDFHHYDLVLAELKEAMEW